MNTKRIWLSWVIKQLQKQIDIAMITKGINVERKKQNQNNSENKSYRAGVWPHVDGLGCEYVGCKRSK